MMLLRRAFATSHSAAGVCSPLASMRMSSTASTSRLAFEELTAGADEEQLEFMKEMVIQVDERDRVLGPITKKDCACAFVGCLIARLIDD